MSRVAVVAYETNPSVCSSMMMHVEMMSRCGHCVILMLQKEIDAAVFDRYAYVKEFFNEPNELPHLFSKHIIEKIWCTNSIYVIRLLRITKLPIYLWKQGDMAAESFMAHHSYARKWVLQMIEAYSIKKSAGVIYVSDAMNEYYTKKYHVSTKSIIVPCLSEFSKIEHNSNRISDSYVYVGGLSVWQCFDETLQIYKKIRNKDSVFHIITRDVEMAKKKVIQVIGDYQNISIYSITDRTQMPIILSKFQFGFLIRKNDVVNLVASPIKFLEYISCGVNVIMTDAVPSFSKIVEKENIGSVIDIETPDVKINAYNSKAQYVYGKLFNIDQFVELYRTLLG